MYEGIIKFLDEYGTLPFIAKSQPFIPTGIFFNSLEKAPDSINIEFGRIKSPEQFSSFTIALPKKHFSQGFNIITKNKEMKFKCIYSDTGFSDNIAVCITCIASGSEDLFSLKIEPAETKNFNGSEFQFE
jgi:hypothetical protein